MVTAAVALTAVALILVSVLPARDYNQAIIEDDHKLNQVTEAMRSYMAAHGELPCPADGKYAFDTANFGVETDTSGDGNCTGAPLGPDKATGDVVAGAIPTKTIDAPDEDAVDAFGHRFLYVVEKEATSNKLCLLLTAGDLTIKSTTGAGGTVLDHGMFAFISGGPSGDGTWPAQGGPTRINTHSSDHDTQADAGFVGDPYSWRTTGVLVQKARDKTFDAIVSYRSDLANTCALGPFSAPGNCNTSQLAGNLSGQAALSFPDPMANNTQHGAYKHDSDPVCQQYTLLCSGGNLSCSTGGSNLADCQYASCTPPKGCNTSPTLPNFSPAKAMNSGDFTYAFAKNIDSVCTKNTLSCDNGTLLCNNAKDLSGCQYEQCNPPSCDTSKLNGFQNPMPVGMHDAFAKGTDTTCTKYQLTCNSDGSLTCSTGGSNLADCQYASCTPGCNTNDGLLQGFSNPLPIGQYDAYANNAATTCTKNTLTCNSGGSLSCSIGGGNLSACAYAKCTPLSGCDTSKLNGFPNPMQAGTQGAFATGSGTCNQNTLTCNSDGSLSCSTGGSNLADCQYANCTPTGASCTTPWNTPFTTPTIAFGNVAGVCTRGLLTCSGGTPNCNGATDLTACQYQTACPSSKDCDTSQLSGFQNPMPSGTSQAFASSEEYPSCTQNTLTCNSDGSLSCKLANGTAGNVTTDCFSEQCSVVQPKSCMTPWGASFTFPMQAYDRVADENGDGGFTCNQHTLSCNTATGMAGCDAYPPGDCDGPNGICAGGLLPVCKDKNGNVIGCDGFPLPCDNSVSMPCNTDSPGDQFRCTYSSLENCQRGGILGW